MRHFHLIPLTAAGFLVIWIAACTNAATPATPTLPPSPAPSPAVTQPTKAIPTPKTTTDFVKEYEDFDPNNFNDPTKIDNPWLPMRPGMQYIYEGVTEEAGLSIPHRVIFTVTDLTKVIGGIRTLVIWDQDFSEDKLVESELAFFAQDNDGNVWHLGQYPEVYDKDGKLIEAPAWISGLKGARAGISMKAMPKLGTPSYSQGWGPAVNWTDRAQVAEMGQQTCVPFDCFEDVLVIEEFSREEPDAFQLKYYASDVGNVRVGWRGTDASKETLELIEFTRLSPEALAEVRARALALEKRAYEISKEVYYLTLPAENP